MDKMSKILYFQRPFSKRLVPFINRRFVSTSKKNNETATAEMCKPEGKAQKDWVYYGFDYTAKKADRNAMHSIMFVSISVCMVVGGFFLAYVPDFNLRDWSQREAFLELRRREKNGLPLVDPNFINPAKIKLPSDKDLGDTDIII